MGKKHPNVVNISEVEPRIESKGTRFGFVGKRLGAQTGSRGLGCSHFEIAPGRQAFPQHFHCANDEATYILEGSGTVRIGKDEIVVSAGDYIAFPPGPEYAHSIRNHTDQPLKLLTISTMIPTEVVGYPDSKKVAAYALDTSKGTATSSPWIRVLLKEQPNEDYYAGEAVD